MRTIRTLTVGFVTSVTALTGFGAAAVASTSGHTTAKTSLGTIVVGNEGFTESDIMQYIYGDLLAKLGYTVKYQSTTSRQEAIPALEAGSIDVEPDYAGSLLVYLDKNATTAAGTIATAETQLNRLLGAKGAAVLAGTSGLDQNVFVVTQATKTKYKLTTLSSLAPHASKWTFGAPPECTQNYFCAPGLKSVYGISFKTVKSYDESGPLTVSALQRGAAQVVELFSTDSVITQDKFYVLSDNKNLEPADHLVAVIRKSFDTAKVTAALQSVNMDLTTSTLTQLDAAASSGSHPTPQAIATGFLQQEKLIS